MNRPMVKCARCHTLQYEDGDHQGFPMPHICKPVVDKSITYRIRLEMLVTQREGMIAENQQRIAEGHSMAYTGEAFVEVENELKQLLIDMENDKC